MSRIFFIYLCALLLVLSGCVSEEGENSEDSGDGSGDVTAPSPPPDAPSLSISDATASEGSGTMTFTVKMSKASKSTVSFKWTTSNASAMSGEDFISVIGRTTYITPGQTSATLTVNIINDTKYEPAEAFFVTLTGAIGASISDPTAIGIISDNDVAPTVSFSAATQTVSESVGSVTVTVTQSGTSPTDSTVPFTVSGTATGGGTDHNLASGTFTIPAGSTTASKAFQIVDDNLVESAETVILAMGTLSAATNGVTQGPQTTQTITINDNDVLPSLSIADVTVAESAGTATFTVSLSAAATSDVTFNWATSNGTATSGQDYTAVNSTSATITAGQTTKTLTVNITDDTRYEPNETFTVSLSGASGATISDNTAVGTITDNDSAPTVEFASASQSISESGGTVTVTVNQSAGSGYNTTIPFTISGTATGSGTDHNLAAGTITITAGSTSGTQTFTVTSDSLSEADETVILTFGTLSAGTNRATAGSQTTHTVTITDDDADPTISIANASVSEGTGAGTTNLTFTITASAASGQAITMDYATSDGTATTADSDYTSTSGTATINAGSTTTTFTVPVGRDALYEANETLTVTLSGGANYTSSGSTLTATGTINNDDTAPSLSISDETVTEGGTATFTVSLSAASGQDTTFSYQANSGGTATAGTDYTSVSVTSATIPTGQTTMTFTVTTTQDSLYEADETFHAIISSASGASISDNTGVGTITNDDTAPTISIADTSVSEGTGAGTTNLTFTITASAASGLPITVNYATSNGTATTGDSDYTSTSGTATVAAGATTTTFTVPVGRDSKHEANETIGVTLSGGSGYTSSGSTMSATGTIDDDDTAPTISIAATSVTEGTGASTTNMTFTVTASAVSGEAITVDYATSDGTATTTDSDYTSTSGTATIGIGATTTTFTVPIAQDSKDEPNETLTITLSGGSGYTSAGSTLTATGTINDDDAAPTISIANVSVTEGTGAGTTNLTFTITAAAVSGQTITVAYATSNGTATTADSDYTSTSGTATIAVGATTTTIDVPIGRDSKYEANETLTMTLSGGANYTSSGSTLTATGTINNDDTAPTISIANVSASEGSGGGTTNFTFTITAAAASGQAITVDYATSNGTATTADSDYTSTNGTATISAGATTATVTVPVAADTKYETNETFTVTLSGGAGYTSSGSTLTATGTINNDDTAPTISFSSASQSVNENVGTVTVTVQLSAASGVNATVGWSRSGDAANPADMNLSASGTFTIAAGSTSTNVTFTVVDDTSDESDETVTLTLDSSPSGATLGSTTAHTVTIVDDDAAASLTVAPVYTGNGNWNTYVVNTDTSGHYKSDNTVCDGTQTGQTLTASCVHSGELLKVQVPEFTDCTNKTMEDNLGVFNWYCDGSTNPVYFYSNGLKPGKGLKDLVNATSWKNNYVSAYNNGTLVNTSTAAAWWSNTVAALPSNTGAGTGQTLSSAGTIYTIASNQTTAGNRITADRIAVVTLPGATLSWNNTVNGFCQSGDTSNGANCVLAAASVKFIWIEGNFTGASGTGANKAKNVIAMSGVKFSRLHQVRANYTNGSSGGSHSIVMDSSHRNLFTDIQAAPFSTMGAGIYAWGCANNVFQNLRLSNGFSGIAIDDSSSQKNIITGAYVIGTYKGIEITTSTLKNTITHVTTAFNNQSGLLFNNAGNGHSVVNLAAFNNGNGIEIQSTSQILFTNIMTTHADKGLWSNNASTNTFKGWFSAGNNVTSNCQIDGGTNPGMTNSTCAQQGSSSVTVNTGKSLASSFIGAITTDEASNASDSNGTATLGATLDFLNFANAFRVWASNASTTATSSSLRGVMDTGTLRIWDWSLSGSDTSARYRSGSGSTTANGTFTNGAACPSELGGSQVQNGVDSQVHLLHAMEIIGDNWGDDDGLCESNEACIYTPNIGAYQGYGDYKTMTCTFSGGTLTGITMYAYPSN